MQSSDIVLPEVLVERILRRLGLSTRPALDADGLNAIYAAWCGAVPFDNVRKRIWFGGDRTTPIPGIDPVDFFEHWLNHGTGGTCWPGNSALYALVHALGFDVRRIAGAMIDSPGQADRAGHGSVVVRISGMDYLVDASIISFEPVRLLPATPVVAGPGIHQVRTAWPDTGVEVIWLAGHARDVPIRFRPSPEFDHVDHAFFVDGYDRSKLSGPFNRALRVCRRYPDSIVTIHRDELSIVAADGSVTRTIVSLAERRQVLIERLGFSEQIVALIPGDEPLAE